MAKFQAPYMFIKKLLSSPIAGFLCFLTALLTRVGMMRAFLGIGPDKAGLLLMTRNLLHGNGITVNGASLNDVSQTVFEHFHRWPPGYNFLLTPILWLMENDYMTASFLLDIAATIVFFIYLRKTLLYIGFPAWLTNLFLLVQGLFINAYNINSNPTDFIGLAFLVPGIYHLIKIPDSMDFSRRHVIGVIVFLFAAVSLRYQYIPVVGVLSLILYRQGYVSRSSVVKKSGTLMFVALSVAIGVMLLYQKMVEGTFANVVPSESGFFPENLLHAWPFIIGSVLNIHFYSVQLGLLFKNGYSDWLELGRWFTMIAFIALLIIFVRWIWQRRNAKNLSPTENFWLFGGMASLLTVGLLIFLSLVRSVEMGPPMFKWTFVFEERYYAYPMLFVQILVWHWLFVAFRVSLLQRILRFIFIFITAGEVLHGAYFLVKSFAAPMTPIAETPWKIPEIKYTYDFIEQQQKNGGRKVIVVSFVRQFGFTAGWYGGSGYFNPMDLNTVLPKTSRPAVLLVAITEREHPYLQKFLQQPGVELIKQVDNYYFYTFYVDPSPV